MSGFLAMVVAHAVADYPLQGDFLSKAKNRAAPIPGVPWYQALGAHAIIHGGAVALITGKPALGVAEAIVHAITDDLKCRGKLTYNQDQAIHLGSKVVWALLASVMSARSAKTEGLGPQDASATAESRDAQPSPASTPTPESI